MKKLLIIVVLAVAIGGCSAPADFDRWTFFQELYPECVDACDFCHKFEKNCDGTPYDTLSCVERFWSQGASTDTCVSFKVEFERAYNDAGCISPEEAIHKACYPE